ncbi:MAG TPA: GAF domain-containing protein, partial [Vicinamibacteria bacterium]|nr:GAF domain-containing protein [Vicinamibacteria bacterium]
MILALGVAVLVLFVLAALIAARTGPVTKDVGWVPEHRWNGTVVVSHVNPDSPAAGRVAAGDTVLAVDGDPSGALWNLWLARPGESYTIRILRGGAAYEFTLPVRVRRDPTWLWLTVSVVPLGLSCYVVGLLVGLLRPEQRASRLLAIATVLFAPGVIVQYFPSDLLTGWAFVVTLAARGPSDLALAVAYQFYQAFPEGVPRGRVTKLLTVVFYTWGVLSCLWWFLAVTPLASQLSHLAYSWRAWDRTWNLLATVNLVAIGVALVQSLRTSMNSDQRRRVKWVLFGSAVAVLPRAAVLVFFVVADALGYHNPLISRALFLSIQLTNFLLLAIPVTLFYAVVKHRLFDISLVLRRGLQYVLARNLLRLTLLLPLVLLVGGVLAHPERTVGEVLFAHPAYLLLMAASGVSLRSRDRLTAWLDRRFFRDAYAKEQILIALIKDVGRHDSLPRLSELVGHGLEQALHPESVQLLFRASVGREFSPGYSSREDPKGPWIAEASSLVQRAQDAGGVVELISSGEAEMSEALGARVLVPIRTSDERLVGMLLLGSKRSEEPYSQTDRKLLEALAAQIAIVYENEALRKRVAEGERVQR